ncbi:hypothetical protein O6P43_027756 [Quillaja saponaria]|uniref:Uncharacterized protein n=1 Tax=Quillaja saponaria TaxID=32244 RepID=A0AAD7L5E6_QUISA|nr:hypothetical protein O6P43_027756 [Quillaja saponaria]
MQNSKLDYTDWFGDQRAKLCIYCRLLETNQSSRFELRLSLSFTGNERRVRKFRYNIVKWDTLRVIL